MPDEEAGRWFAPRPSRPSPTEDEAILQMELLGHDFFVFMHASNGDVNVLYRRNDGDYGLIKPRA
jgi:putative sigma-54 modulation protein